MEDKIEDETIENKRKRLRYRSWHRGIKEMDIILGTFADKHIDSFDEVRLAQYDEIIRYSDPDLYNWITGREEAPANVVNDLFTMLINHKVVE